MATYKDEKSDDVGISSGSCSLDNESSMSLLGGLEPAVRHQSTRYKWSLVLYFIIVVQSVALLALTISVWTATDPTLAIWSPARKIVKYQTLTSTPYFDNRSPYLGNDTERVDQLWKDLYDAGMISVISKGEASRLLNKTRAAPKTPDLYLVQLQVFHDLHCLNLIRKWVYMDVYHDQAEWINGAINHDTVNALHVDHCIDALRQSVMCTGDVTPRKFAPHANERQYYVYPSIYVTQTCRNYNVLQDWAAERRVVEWMMSFDEEWEKTRFDTTLP